MERDVIFINYVNVPPKVPYIIFSVLLFNLQNRKLLIEKSIYNSDLNLDIAIFMNFLPKY